MQHTDPLDQLAALGLRIAWVEGLPEQVSYIPDLAVIIADPNLCRREITRLALALLADENETGDGLPTAS